MSAISEKYLSLGGHNGFLKNPIIPESTCPDGFGRFRHYESGSIYWSPATEAHEIHGEIYWRWSTLGWEKSLLGYPLTDELNIPDGGRYSKFQNGYIAWTPEMMSRVLYDGPNQDQTGNDLSLSNLTTTACGNLNVFYEKMRDWYGIDLKAAVITRNDGTTVNISGWPFVTFTSSDTINNSILSSRERFIITVAQILIMQWYMHDYQNHDSIRRNKISNYCRGCFKQRSVLRHWKSRWLYNKWCSEFVSYVYRRCGESFTIHHTQYYMCSNVAKFKDNDWCCRTVAAFRKEFKHRNRWWSIADVQSNKYTPQAGDYIRSDSHSMLVLGVDPGKTSNSIYIVNGNVGNGRPEGNGKVVAVGWKDIHDSALAGVGEAQFV